MDNLITRLRPQRWDQPYGDDMPPAMVDRLLEVAPFVDMEPRVFPRSTPLRGILLNDTRVVRYEPGQLVVHEGDYGDSAFLVLDGSLRVALDQLSAEQTGRTTEKRRGKLWRALAQLLPTRNAPESRPAKYASTKNTEGIFLQDVPTVLGATRTAQLQVGEVFGELTALTRAPRSASVFAEEGAVLLEIRWQGLRDLMRYTPALKEHIHRVYRKNSLRVHLRETPLLAGLSEESLGRVAGAIEFQTFGSFDWREEDSKHNDPLTRIEREPIIVEEGQPVNDLLLVRSGFARVTVAHGEGHRTLAYLGRGQALGAEELAVGVMQGEPAKWRRSLRAVGYLDVLRLPADAFVREVLPTLASEQVSQWVRSEVLSETPAQSELSVGSTMARRLDFLVDHRLVNGTEAMVVDLDRCTRCDDCIRACAATHDGNPRFIRQGPTLDNYQYMHACMHCVDPVCMIGCPTGAIHRDEATGVVRINDSTCIGCSTCADSCPYSNIQMVEIRDQQEAFIFDETTGQPILRATKCDLCVDQWTGPACQNACPHDALVRINLAEPVPLTTWTNR